MNCRLSPTLRSSVELQLSSRLHVVSSVVAEEMRQIVIEVLSSSFVLTSRSPGCVCRGANFQRNLDPMAAVTGRFLVTFSIATCVFPP